MRRGAAEGRVEIIVLGMSTQGERTLTMYSDDKNIYIITPLNKSGPAPTDARTGPEYYIPIIGDQ